MGKPETLVLLRSLAGSCSEVPEGWCKAHDSCGACWNHALDMLEKELDDYVGLPRDANEMSVRPGDDIHLDHNDKVRHVVSMSMCEDGTWLVHCDSGGGFSMPDSKEYVTHAKPDTFERIITDALRMPVHDKAMVAEFSETVRGLAGGRA